MNGYDHGPGPYSAPARNPAGPTILLALALGCVLLFLVLWDRSRPGGDGPLRKPTPGEHRAPGGSGRLTVEFLDVGQGDSTLIRSPEGKLALVDAGPSGRVVATLRRLGVERLDLAVVSHHHADHYGGMLDVVRAFRPRVFLDAPSPHASKAYEALLRAVRDEGTTAIEPTASARTIELGTARLTVFPRAPLDEKEENNNSIGIRVDYGDFSALLTGDSEGRERTWWRQHAPDLAAGATVMKLAHHGSRNGLDDAWLRLVAPQLAVGSMAAGNDFGHPHPETLRRLRLAGVPLDRTDRDGTVTVVSDGQTWSQATDRGGVNAGAGARAEPAGAASGW